MTPHTQLYREIPLTKGMVALVDASDYEWISSYNWCALGNGQGSLYAYRSVSAVAGKRLLGMHRMIMGLHYGQKLVADHINGNTLDNRRSNLRVAEVWQNTHNAAKRSNNTSGFKGAFWHKTSGRWKSQIRINGRSVHLGYFESAQEASDAYKAAAIHYIGDFAKW